MLNRNSIWLTFVHHCLQLITYVANICWLCIGLLKACAYKKVKFIMFINEMPGGIYGQPIWVLTWHDEIYYKIRRRPNKHKTARYLGWAKKLADLSAIAGRD